MDEPLMPEFKTAWHDLTRLPGERGREDAQGGWHAFIGSRYSQQTILDVGAGLGLSRSRLAQNGNVVTLQDPGPDLNVDLRCDVAEIASKSYDLVTCFDVLEHVLSPEPFVAHLARIARVGAFITTPNWNVFHAGNDFHCCEYTPRQLLHLLRDLIVLQLWVADPQGYRPQQVSHEEFVAIDHPALAVLFTDK